MAKHVFVTGAFGNVGHYLVRQLLERGYTVLAADLDNETNRQRAKDLGIRHVIWGDIRNIEDHRVLIEQQDVIIHLAAVLPPVCDANETLSREINVGATETLLRLAAQSARHPLFIYISSVSVYGLPDDSMKYCKPNSPVKGEDNYARQKIEAETRVRSVALPWVIMRLGVSIDENLLGGSFSQVASMFRVRGNNHLEYVHPSDVATAIANAIECPEAAGKTLLIGGGASCQITQREFMRAVFGAFGVYAPKTLHGTERYYTHWMDTSESQRLLKFQRHTFADFTDDLRQKSAMARWLTLPWNPLILGILHLIKWRDDYQRR